MFFLVQKNIYFSYLHSFLADSVCNFFLKNDVSLLIGMTIRGSNLWGCPIEIPWVFPSHLEVSYNIWYFLTFTIQQIMKKRLLTLPWLRKGHEVVHISVCLYNNYYYWNNYSKFLISIYQIPSGTQEGYDVCQITFCV